MQGFEMTTFSWMDMKMLCGIRQGCSIKYCRDCRQENNLNCNKRYLKKKKIKGGGGSKRDYHRLRQG